MSEEDAYDVVVVGGGPSGAACAIAAQEGGVRACVVDPMGIGGRLLTLGHVRGAGRTGTEIATELIESAAAVGVDVHYDAATLVEPRLGGLAVACHDTSLSATAVVLATGQADGPLGLPDERELHGRGVSYCASCDGPLYRGQTVAVVGDSDWAIAEALELAEFAARVLVVHAGTTLACSDELRQLAAENEKLTEIPGATVTALGSDGTRLASLTVASSSGERTLDVGGVFPLFGWAPDVRLLADELLRAGDGAVAVDASFATNVAGVFAVGDVTHKADCTVERALADGAIAGASIARLVLS